MDVLRDDRVPEGRCQSPVRAAQLAGRFVVFTLLLTVAGDDHKQARRADRETNATPYRYALSPTMDDLDGRSLIGPDMRSERTGAEPIAWGIDRTRGTLHIVVNDKAYAIGNHPLMPMVDVGSKIEDVTLRDGIVEIHSAAYGAARVNRAEVERVLTLLSNAESPAIRVMVAARYEPKGGTPIAAAMALKRLWHERDTPECYTVTFERMEEAPPSSDVAAR